MKTLQTLFLFLFLSNILQAQLSEPKLMAHMGSHILDAKFMHINNDTIIDVVYSRDYVEGSPVSGMYQGIGYYEEGNLFFNTVKISSQVAQNVVLVDLDNDGITEVLINVIYPDISTYELYKLEDEIFVISDMLPSFLDSTYYPTISVKDLNFDGKDDFYTFKDGYTVAHYQQNVTDLFLHDTIHNSYYLKGSADINHDNLMDYILLNSDNYYLYSMISNSNGDYEPVLLDTSFNYKKKLDYIGDIDYDGEVDLTYRYIVEDKMYVMHNLYDADLPEQDVLFSAPFGGSHWLDINTDGYIDNYKSNKGIFWINDGNGVFDSIPGKLPAKIYGALYNEVDTASNSALYVVLAYTMEGITCYDSIWGNYAIGVTEPIISRTDESMLKDVNSDGFLDLVIAGHSSSIVCFKGDSNKQFSQPINLVNGVIGVNLFRFADFNGDGHEDIAYTSLVDGTLNIRYGDGDGNFNNTENILKGAGLVRGLAAFDFAGDGFADLLVSSLTTNSIMYFKNIDGVFSEMEILLEEDDYFSLNLEDVDNDGDMDIIYSIYGGNATQGTNTLINDGSGVFTDIGLLVEDCYYCSYFDFDGDQVNERVYELNDIVYIEKMVDEGYEEWLVLDPEWVDNSHFEYIILDYDGDNYKDILLYDTSNEHFTQLFKNVNNENFIFDGYFEDQMGYHIEREGFGYEVFNDVDIDGDGDIDMFYVFEKKIFKVVDQKDDLSITGITYWDVNNDSLYTTDIDIRLSNVEVTCINEEDLVSTYSHNNGDYRVFLNEGEYEITATPPNECWIPNFTIPLPIIADKDTAAIQNFGFLSNFNSESDLVVSLSRAPTRCGFTVVHFVTIKNEGCQPINGNLTYVIDALVSNIAQISNVNFSLDGNTIYSDSINLLPGEQVKFNFAAEMPGFEHISEFITDSISIVYDEIDGSLLNKEKTQIFNSEISCAVDPNDKNSYPDRSEEYGTSYIIDEDIFYTIRFQNTGNDTAFNITLLDTISEYLDISSFSPVDASHEYDILLRQEERILAINFKDILLPDSTTNQVGSNGFFTFKIRPLLPIEDFVPIENTAAIYFDFNPPIFTNTDEMVYVSNLDIVSTFDPKEYLDIQVLPNPATQYLELIYEGFAINTSIYDIDGKEVNFDFLRSKKHLDISSLSDGMYIIILDFKDRKEVARFVKVESEK